MVEPPTTTICSEEQIQSMVRNIFGELFEAERSGSSSRQHSSVASEISQRFRLPRHGVPELQNNITTPLGRVKVLLSVQVIRLVKAWVKAFHNL